MDNYDLATSLAVSLTNGDWSQDHLTSQLSRRLPSALHRLSASMGAQLITAHSNIYAPPAWLVAETLLQSAEFDRIFQYCQRQDIWPALDLQEPCMAPIRAFASLDTPQIGSPGGLADWLRLPVNKVDYFADTSGRYENHSKIAANHYHYSLRPKKSGGTRVIEAPKQILKSIQRQILRGILDRVQVHRDAFGFVRGRNCVEAAARHAAEEIVVNFDLRDFFPSVGTARIFGLFRCLGYPYAVATHLTGLCTTTSPKRILQQLDPASRALYREQHLPQGAPTSPALANLVAFNLDRRLAGLAGNLSANYSRYADDLSFSGDRRIVSTLLKAVPEITRDEGLSLNHTKTHIMSATSRQLVTGIIVNRHVNVPRKRYDQIKATIHACGRPEDERLSDPTFRTKLLGEISWVETLNAGRGQKLRQKLATSLHKKASHQQN